jgi:hypothetical protein
MLGILKKIFSKNEPTKSGLTVLTEDEETKASSRFKKEYFEKLKKIKTSEEFHGFAVSLVVNRIKQTDYGKYAEFVSEIKYFIHYLLLVVKDDYTVGDKICQHTLTQFDNYIFSAYRKKPELAENIKKFSLLAGSKRFIESPKENILSYFVFLEENGIDLVQILKDYTEILEGHDSSQSQLPKKVEEKIKNNNLAYESLHSVLSTNINPSAKPKNLEN